MANRTQVKDAIKSALNSINKANQAELIMRLIEFIDDEVSYDLLILELKSIANELNKN